MTNEAVRRKIELILNEFAYTKFLDKLVSFCAQEISDREDKTGIDTFLLRESLNVKTSFDLRTVAYNVSIIGDSFLKFSDSADFSKLPFADDEAFLSIFLSETIEAYLLAEVKAINKFDFTFAVNVMKSIAYQNSEKGYRAEEAVLKIIRNRYNENESAADGRSEEKGAEGEIE